MEFSKDMYDLKLNESNLDEAEGCNIIRVPGGWIYNFGSNSIFIKYNEEFKIKSESKK